MLQKEVAVSEIWVIHMLHNWCAGVDAQYGPWSSLQITVWTPLFFPSLSLSFPPLSLPSPHIPVSLIPPKSYQKHCLWVGTTRLSLPFHSAGGCVAFICVCGLKHAYLFSEVGWEESSVMGIGTAHAPCPCLLGFSCPSDHPLLPVMLCWLLFIFACSASWTSDSSIFPGPGLALYIHCLLATCCMEQVCLG